MAGRVSDVYFMNGNTLENIAAQIEQVRTLREQTGQGTIQFGINGFVIVRTTEEEAKQVLRDIVTNANQEAVAGFKQSVKSAGAASPEGEGMWAHASDEDLLQYNEGFKTGLIGTAEQVADRIIELKKIGVDIVLTGFLHYEEDLEAFGKNVLPLVREKEKQLQLEAIS